MSQQRQQSTRELLATPMHNHRASPHKLPATNSGGGRGGHFHRQSHDTFVLDDWLDATRASVNLNKATVRQRSKVQDVCAKELLHQVSVGSPKIATMLARVWNERSSLMEETMRKMEHQTQVRDFAQTELLNVARSAGVRLTSSVVVSLSLCRCVVCLS